MTTFRSGLRIFAVSAINRTPQTTIRSALASFALTAETEAVAHHIGERLDLQGLVVMRHDNSVLSDFERTNLHFHCYVPTTRGFSRFFKSVRMERAAI